jgi:hypothetical protein
MSAFIRPVCLTIRPVRLPPVAPPLPAAAQEGFDEVRAGGEFGRGTLHPHLAAAEHIGPLRDGQHGLGALLDDQHRRTARRQLADVLVQQLRGHRRGQVRGGLVEQEHAGVEHERAAHREHLAFAAAEFARGAPEHPGEPGKHGQHPLDVLSDLRFAQQVAAHLEVLPDRQLTGHVVHLRHVAHTRPGDLLRGLASWKVRTSPSRARRNAGIAVMSCPR